MTLHIIKTKKSYYCRKSNGKRINKQTIVEQITGGVRVTIQAEDGRDITAEFMRNEVANYYRGLIVEKLGLESRTILELQEMIRECK